MATAYTSQSYLNSLRSQSDSGDFCAIFAFSMSAAFVINDTVALCPIPNYAGVYILDWYLSIPALDSSTGSTVALGDGTTANAFMTTTAAGQSSAGSVLYSQANGVVGYLPKGYYVGTPIASGTNAVLTLKIIAAPSGTATTTGTIKGYLRMSMIGTTPNV